MSEPFAGSPSWDDIDADSSAFYQRVLQTLNEGGVPFLVGGAFAFACFTGIQRHTKDMDLFIRREHYERIQELLRSAGYHTELTFPHWLAKVHAGDAFVDLIFNSGNGIVPVDDGWFAHALDAEVLGVPVKIAPAEETLWSKAFIMERERYDGADIAHLLRSHAPRLNWQRLLDRFGPHWRVLLAHLVLFGFVYPGERSLVPAWLIDELLDRLRREGEQSAPATRLCAGTLLSRAQYLHDIAHQGYQDGRVTPFGGMTPKDVARWTEAIAHGDSSEPPTGTD